MLRLTLSLVMWISMTAPAAGAPPCLQQKAMEDFLLQDHGEELAGWGTTANGYLLEHFVDPVDGSFSWVATSPAGISCMVGAGEPWHDKKPEDPEA